MSRNVSAMFDRPACFASLDAGGIGEEPVDVDFPRQPKQLPRHLLGCFSCERRRPVFVGDDDRHATRHARNFVRQIVEGEFGRAGRRFFPGRARGGMQGRHDRVDSVIHGHSKTESKQRCLRIAQRVELAPQHHRQLVKGVFDLPPRKISLGQGLAGDLLRQVRQQMDFRVLVAC